MTVFFDWGPVEGAGDRGDVSRRASRVLNQLESMEGVQVQTGGDQGVDEGGEGGSDFSDVEENEVLLRGWGPR